MGTLPCFFSIVTKGNNFHDFLFAFLDDVAFKTPWSTLKGKNLLLLEQILFFNS